MLESEGLTENMNKENYRWNIIDRIISPLKLSQFMVEADDQDVFCKYIEIYGPNIKFLWAIHFYDNDMFINRSKNSENKSP